MERIGIYGGTFSPIHNGHVGAAREFLERLELDKLYIIPAAVPPHKEIPSNDDPAHRFEMCRLAFAGESKIIVSDIEIKRGGKSYTVDTLTELTAENRKLFMMCGTDMILTFEKWHNFKRIFELCTLVYVSRDPDQEDEANRVIERYRYDYGADIKVLKHTPEVLASVDIRSAICEGKSIDGLVPDSVKNYIYEHSLYGGL